MRFGRKRHAGRGLDSGRPAGHAGQTEKDERLAAESDGQQPLTFEKKEILAMLAAVFSLVLPYCAAFIAALCLFFWLLGVLR